MSSTSSTTWPEVTGRPDMTLQRRWPHLAFLLPMLTLACGRPSVAPAPTAIEGATPEAAAPSAAPAVGGSTGAPGAATAADLPPPFDADALRAGLTVGTRIRFRMTPGGEEEWEVVAADERGCTITTRKGGGEETEQVSWTDLEGHARFPAAQTTREETQLTIAAGSMTAWHYTVTAGPAEMATVREFWFAAGHPGPPVLMTIRKAGDEVVRMELLSRSGG
jgi:hypothetical protein